MGGNARGSLGFPRFFPFHSHGGGIHRASQVLLGSVDLYGSDLVFEESRAASFIEPSWRRANNGGGGEKNGRYDSTLKTSVARLILNSHRGMFIARLSFYTLETVARASRYERSPEFPCWCHLRWKSRCLERVFLLGRSIVVGRRGFFSGVGDDGGYGISNNENSSFQVSCSFWMSS